MRPVLYHTQDLSRLFKRQKVATMNQLKQALGTSGHMTVFRKLKQLGYRTSYSHRGRFYTLERVARFDSLGLWSDRDIWFSKYGTLLATAQAVVTGSESGYFVRELDGVLHVSTKKAVQQLVDEKRILRERVSGWYLYCASDSAKRKQQLRARQVLEAELILEHGLARPRVSTDELKAAILLFYGLLDEKQRRLYAGMESLKFGYGGDRKIANLLGLDVHTVAKARQELLEAEVERQRVRKPGGGRKAIKKNARSRG